MLTILLRQATSVLWTAADALVGLCFRGRRRGRGRPPTLVARQRFNVSGHRPQTTATGYSK
jgi:hypothetical protein